MPNPCDSEIEQLVKLLADAIKDSKPRTLGCEARQAAGEYKKIAEALRGFPNKHADKEEPRWKIPPLSPRAIT